MITRTLMGPFLTRAQVAHLLNVPPSTLPSRPDLLRVGGTWLQEVYFAFQFDHNRIRRGVSTVVLALKREYGDEAIADWLIRPHAEMGHDTPLHWLCVGREPSRVLEASTTTGPIVDEPCPVDTSYRVESETSLKDHSTHLRRSLGRQTSLRHNRLASTH